MKLWQKLSHGDAFGGHRHAHLVGKTACAKAAQYPRGMCEAALKAVAVIKSSEEETHLMSVDREDMCEDDAMWEETPGKPSWPLPEDQDCYYEGLRDSATGE